MATIGPGSLQDNVQNATRDTGVTGNTAFAVVNPDGTSIGSGSGSGSSIITGTVQGTSGGTQRTYVNNKKIQVLSAHDLVSTYTWLDFGTKQERVSTIIYTSATFLGETITRTFDYTLVGTKYRLDTETWTSSGGG